MRIPNKILCYSLLASLFYGSTPSNMTYAPKQNREFLTSVCLDDYWNQQRVGKRPVAPSPRISNIHKNHYSGGLSLSYQPLIDNIGGHRSTNPKWKGAFQLNPWKDGQRHGTKILNSEPGFDLGILMFQCQGWTPRPKIKTCQQV